MEYFEHTEKLSDFVVNAIPLEGARHYVPHRWTIPHEQYSLYAQSFMFRGQRKSIEQLKDGLHED
jgi:hypothetical protein